MHKLLKEIKSIVPADIYRNAQRLFNSGAVLFCRENRPKNYEFTISETGNGLIKVQIDYFDKLIETVKTKSISVYELASVIHYLSNSFVKRYIEKRNTASEKRTGIEIPEVSKNSACLEVSIQSRDLHATSTWESCKVLINIYYRNRSYIGNSNRLRQLRFDETRNNSFTLLSFSFQDRQVIRFLTQYAEVEGKYFVLKADLMAEFLHCFDENKHIYLSGKPLIIHSENARLAGLYKSEEKRVYPGLIVNDNILPLSGCNIIAGKSGFWLGYIGEYWWTPAHADVLWLRKFLLSDGFAEIKSSKIKEMPFPVLEYSKTAQVRYIPCIPVYYVNYSENNEIILCLKFKYLDKELSMSEQRISSGKRGFWKRDKLTEDTAANEVKLLGFSPEKSHKGHFSISDTEQQGLFFDIVLKKWFKNGKHLFMSPESAELYYKLYPLQISFSVPRKNRDIWTFKYSVSNQSGGCITWNKLRKTVKSNRRYVRLDNKMLASVSRKTAEFLRNIEGVIKPAEGKKGYLKIPNAALLYLLENENNVVDTIPKQWLKIKKDYRKDSNNLSRTLIKKFNGNLRSYQETAVKWLLNMADKRFNSVLADEMGLGKTVQALAFINLLKNIRNSNYPCMVVCPTSLIENWRTEAGNFIPELNTVIISGAKRREIINNINKYDLVITSYALVKKDIDYYIKSKFSLLILDEAQHIKNPSTINAKVCKSIKAENRLVLTGTPLENSPEDVWSIFDFLNPGMLGNRENFKRLYTGIENNREKQKELSQRIAPFILRRHKSEVENLPLKTEKTVYCKLLPEQEELYKSILNDGKMKYDMFVSGKNTRFDVLSSITRLRQICCHPKLLPDIMQKGNTESAKMELLKELLLETLDSGQKTLVFSQFTSLLKIIKGWLDEQNILYEYLDGGTDDRQKRVDRYNEDKNIKLFLLSLKAGGVGLNLTSASNVIIYDPWWNPTAESQAADRIHRIGQHKPANIFKLVVKDSIEEKILELQRRKQGLFNGIIESGSGINKISDNDLAFLFKTEL
ncbi:MAG: DEAD/DEAH box helicase [Victivallales bacterium]|nr:DEAD/DEAH box helicase [Victivallales bacterium]MCF7889338.1 DEAD/DEAH box helicase [Victivallales bacterium]